jgi:NADH dehydrogenase FAD-containing subunit
MIAGGVLGNAVNAKKSEHSYVVRSQQSLFNRNKGVNWVPKTVASFNPEQNQITLSDGTVVTYEYLIVNPGC